MVLPLEFLTLAFEFGLFINSGVIDFHNRLVNLPSTRMNWAISFCPQMKAMPLEVLDFVIVFMLEVVVLIIFFRNMFITSLTNQLTLLL